MPTLANKTTLIENAQKFLQKGQLDRAVKEYERALQLDPKDLRVRHKLGELLARKGDRTEALRELGAVAESYAADGFFLKAIAVYKQILKLKRDAVDVHLRLGQLYHQLSLFSDAMEHYNDVAAFLEQNQRWPECLEVYERIVDLNPADIEHRVRLADIAVHADRPERAVELLRAVIGELQGTGKRDELIRLNERLLQLVPGELEIHKALSRLYIDAGDFRRALTKLQACFKADSSDVATLSMLADVFQALDQLPKALAVLKELARLHDYHGRPDLKAKVLERIARIDPEDPDVVKARMAAAPPPRPVAIPAPAAPVTPNAPAAVAPPAASPTPAPGISAAVVAPGGVLPITADGDLARLTGDLGPLMGEVDGLIAAARFDDALRRLKEGLLRDPNCFRVHDRLRQLLIATGDRAGATRVTLMQLKLAVAARQLDPARAAAACALALSPDDSTVVMLTSRLGVTQAAAITVGALGVSSPPAAAAPVSAPSRAPSDGLVDDTTPGDGLVDDAPADDGLVDDEPAPALVRVSPAAPANPPDGLVDDDADTYYAAPTRPKVELPVRSAPAPAAVDDDDLALAMALNDSADEDDDEVNSLHLGPDDESLTLVGVPAPQSASATSEGEVHTYEGDLVDLDDEDDDVQDRLEMARTWLDMGLYDDALQELAGLRLNAHGMWLMGRIQLGRGDGVQALRWLEGAKSDGRIDPSWRTELSYDLARAYERTGDDFAALEYYRKVFSEDREYRPSEVKNRITLLTRRIQSAGGSQASR